LLCDGPKRRKRYNDVNIIYIITSWQTKKEKYSGDWKNGNMEGKGKMEYLNNNEYYEGEFLNNDFENEGTYYFSNGSNYLFINILLKII
jgi:hypothetical protein